MGKDGGTDQTFENSKWTETESCAKNREESIEGRHGPAAFGKDEDDDLSDDEELIDNGPKDPSCLVWNCAIPDVITSLEQLVNRRPRGFCILKKVVDSGDVVCHDEDAAHEHEDEGNNANSANRVETEEEYGTR